ncbi:MAG TPA: PKD domain-containing protein [Noviherbaspirillum sp.]
MTGTSEQVNVNNAGQGGNATGTGAGGLPSMSSDGRFVAFESDSTNLVANDTNNTWDIFVRDRSAGTTERVSVSSAGVQSAAYNTMPNLSADGRYVVFAGLDGNLDLSGNKIPGVFIHDRVTRTTRLVDNMAAWPVTSTNGQYVAYQYSPGTNTQIAVADLGPPASVSLSTTTLSLTEGGTAGTYTAVLATAPTANVTLTISPNSQLSASPAQLIFTPTNWNVPQTVTVQAIQDGIVEGNHTGTISHTVTSTDQSYNGISIPGLTVAINDAVIPVAIIPVTSGTVWTQSGLPVTGTAAPGATVMVTATNLTTSTVSAASAVANANGAWSLTLTGLVDGNYELQPEASGLKGNKLTFTADITGSLRPVLLPPVPDGGVWTQANVPLRGTAPPGSTVILHILGLHNGATSTRTTVAADDGTWSILLPDLEDCHYQLQAEVNGLFSNLLIVNVDSHAPMTTLSVSLGSSGSGGGATAGGASVGSWNTGSLTIGLSAVDGAAGQGVDRIEYRLDDGAWIVFPGAGLTLDHDGIYNFCYRSVDLAGNVEQAHCVPLWIDTAAPTVTPSFDAARNLLSLNATDAVSGIDSLEISLDGGITWTSSSGTVSFPHDGRYTVLYRCRDKAGNVTTGQTTVTVATLPSLSLPPDQSAIEGRAQSFTLGSFADQGSDSPWRLDIDWGDGFSHDVQTLAAPGSLGSRMHAYPDNGMYTVTLKITDAAGNTSSKSFRIGVINAAPTADLVAGGPINEGSTASVALRNPSDPSGIDIQAGFHYAFACDGGTLAGATYANSSAAATAACAYADGPSTHMVRARIIDKDDGFTEYMESVVVNNVPPSVGPVTAPAAPVALNTAVNVHAGFTDPGVLDTHTTAIDWGDGTTSSGSMMEANGSGSVTGTHSYATPGLYTVKVTVTDKDGGVGSSSYRYVVVVDPNGPFVTGGGQVDLPEGPAQFDFVVKYKDKGQSTPTGNGQLQLTSGKFSFRSSRYDWLVATEGKAVFAGSGTLNGAGDYGFMVNLIDAGSGKKGSDALRIKIWDKATGAVVYDTQPGAAETADPTLLFSGGNITIHK